MRAFLVESPEPRACAHHLSIAAKEAVGCGRHESDTQAEPRGPRRIRLLDILYTGEMVYHVREQQDADPGETG